MRGTSWVAFDPYQGGEGRSPSAEGAIFAFGYLGLVTACDLPRVVAARGEVLLGDAGAVGG